MAIPYFKYNSTYVYFDNGMIIDYPINHEHPQSVARSEDLKLKVYDHSLAGTYKRIWRLKAAMDEQALTDHKYSNWLSFVTSTIVYAKYKFSYYDKDGNSYTVRLIEWTERMLSALVHEVSIIIEEDYA